MKRAKFMLLGIGVLGVAGGALAFNAKSFSGTYFCTTLTDTQCDLNTPYAVSVKTGRVPLHCTLQTAPIGTACTKTISVTKND